MSTTPIRYDGAATAVLCWAGFGAAGFACQGWNPVVGMVLVGGIAGLLAGGAIIMLEELAESAALEARADSEGKRHDRR